jgi:hypothetical protein
MADAPLTEAEAEAILAEPMSIAGPVVWSQKGHESWAEARLKVKHARRDRTLTVVMTVNLFSRRKCSISLLLDNAHRIRGLDVLGSHDNKHTDTNRWRGQTHEHCWTDACRGSWARSTDDPPDVQQALMVFCERLGITFEGEWTDPPPGQWGLEDI